MSLLYSVLWKAARPFLRLHKRLGEDFAERLLPADWPAANAPSSYSLWLHSASGGEAYLVREIARELAARAVDLDILCTSCTRQGLDVLRRTQAEFSRGPLRLDLNYLPLDDPALMRRAARRVKPRVLALLETELWPGLLKACREQGAKILILNARMSASSFKGYRLLRPLLRPLAPDALLAVSREDLERFCAVFGAPGLEPAALSPDAAYALMPNIKFDRLCAEKTDEAQKEAAPDPALPLVLALASVRKEEESLLQPLLAGLLAKAPDCALALAPRHLHRLAAWERRLSAMRLPYTRRSLGGEPQAGALLLWDSFGDLPLLYRRARAVFVGGSLAPLGGQNFLEPIAHGLRPCIGPYWDNFTWAGREIFDLGLAFRARNVAELESLLLKELRTAPAQAEVKALLAAYLEQRRGGARKAAELLLRALKPA